MIVTRKTSSHDRTLDVGDIILCNGRANGIH